MNKNNEKGQIIVILALAIVAIVGITALALDGGMIYSDRRQDQDNADSAALAGASAAAQLLKISDPSAFYCGSTLAGHAATHAVDSAQATALQNNVVLSRFDLSTNNGVDVVCGVKDGLTYLDIETIVSTTRETTLAKIIGTNETTSTVDATARVYSNPKFAGGNGIVTTGTGVCTTSTGIDVSGTSRLETVKAGIMSNNCITVSGSARVLAYAGTTKYFNSNGLNLGWSTLALNDTNANATPTNTAINESIVPQSSQPVNLRATKADTQFPEMSIPPMVKQSCTGLVDRGSPNLGYSATPITILPGIYTQINQGWTEVIMSPGVYCIKPGGSVNLGGRNVYAHNTKWYFMGDGTFEKTATEGLYMDNSSVYLTKGNFNVSNGASITANNITVYIKEGNFNISGNVPAIMTAPGCNTSACGVGPAIPGLLLYMDKTNTGSVMIQNSSSLDIEGTIFAPNSTLTVSGDANLRTLQAQIIAKRVMVSGSSNFRLDLTNAFLYSQGASTIELLK